MSLDQGIEKNRTRNGRLILKMRRTVFVCRDLMIAVWCVSKDCYQRLPKIVTKECSELFHDLTEIVKAV